LLHPIRWLIRLVVLAVLVGAGFGAWYVFGSDAPAKPKLTGCEASAAGGPATPAGTWKVAPGKDVYVGYRITEVFRGDVIHKTAVGRTPGVTGTMKIVGNQLTVTDITADMQKLASDRGTRDTYIRTHGIDSDTYKQSTFKLTKPVALPGALKKCTVERLTATGSLTLHGVTRSVQVPLQARWSGATIEVDATDIPVKLADYKITPPKTSVTQADDRGSIEFALTFTPA
jgi:polyisoprenoid-binding protein YceI